MLNKIFITIILLCGISFANELENCVVTVSRDSITFHCDYNGGNSNYKISFRKSNITDCTETSYIRTSYTERTETTIEIHETYYYKTVKDELGATIVKSIHIENCEDVCRDSYLHLKSISARKSTPVREQKYFDKFAQR